MALTEANICLRWLEECGRIDPIFPTEKANEQRWVYDDRLRRSVLRPGTWTLSINEDGHLIYEAARRTVELARFVGERRLISSNGGAVLLNGNGFDGMLTQIQTRLRARAHKVFGQRHVMIVPFLALTGAEIEYDSILPIHIATETWTNNRLSIVSPTQRQRPPRRHMRAGETDQFEWSGRTWRYQRSYLHKTELSLLHQPPNGTSGWHEVRRDKEGSYISERIHNLGSSVFSAVGPDGERHRYISAFDDLERNQMYFLAQLPDEGECKNYVEAIRLLAPPIVHKARAEGRRVWRQGDIFAIETDMTTRRLRRQKAKFVERSDVLDTGGSLKVSRRSQLRRLAMIYGTGHTASDVAVKPDGSTFVRGTLFHNPILERAGRDPEHVPRRLSPVEKWFLCVRNTVPRATTTTRGR